MRNLTDGLLSGVSHNAPDNDAGRHAKLHCSICQRRLSDDIAFLDETGNVPEPRRSWMLCAACDAAVRAEIERSPVQGPLRLRVAVGVVAADRSPTSVHALAAGLREINWLPFLFWVFGIAMVIHLFVLVWVVSLLH